MTAWSSDVSKRRLSVYLEPDLLRELQAFAEKRGKSQSLVAEAAIASFLSPDAAERQEAAVTKRLDRLARQLDRADRDTAVLTETLALFVRHWLTVTPSLPESAHPAARAKGRERYDDFVQALGRRLSKGARFTREIAEDLPALRPLDDARPHSAIPAD